MAARPADRRAPGGESLVEVQARLRPAGLPALAEGGVPGSLDRSQVAGYMDPVLTHPWSIAVGHDGAFKVTLLTLFDLPLERFWMWTMDLAAITVIEFRAGRPVMRAHNLTGHLATVLDEAAQEEQEAAQPSGASRFPSERGTSPRRVFVAGGTRPQFPPSSVTAPRIVSTSL